jgi:hypothetical protein
MSTPASQTTSASTGGNGRWAPPAPGTRSADEIKNDIVRQREELSRSVEALRTRWARVTDLRAQIKEHKAELLVGAAVVGFLVGGAIALGRRRG